MMINKLCLLIFFPFSIFFDIITLLRYTFVWRTMSTRYDFNKKFHVYLTHFSKQSSCVIQHFTVSNFFLFVSRHFYIFLFSSCIFVCLCVYVCVCQTFKSACIFDVISIKCIAQVFEFTSIVVVDGVEEVKTRHRNSVEERNSLLLSAVFQLSATPSLSLFLLPFPVHYIHDQIIHVRWCLSQSSVGREEVKGLCTK